MFRCNAPDTVTPAQLAEAQAARLITKADAALLAGPRPSLFKDQAHADAWQAAYNKLPSHCYELRVVRSSHSPVNPSATDGEFSESASGLEAARTRMEELKSEGLAILLMQGLRGPGYAKKPAAIWYSDHYKGKRLAA